jgi:hypothetical protein
MAFERDVNDLVEVGADGVEVHLVDRDEWVTAEEWHKIVVEADDYVYYDAIRLDPIYDEWYESDGILIHDLALNEIDDTFPQSWTEVTS